MKPTAELLGRLLDQHGAALALYAAQWTTAADDCVQEALVDLARQTAPPDNPVAWLYQIVKRRALNHARGERRRKTHEQAAWRGRFTARAVASTNHEDHAVLIEALTHLPEVDREILTLKIWGGLTFAEIAEVTGGSSSTAHRRYEQALTQLRQLWGVTCPGMTKPECP